MSFFNELKRRNVLRVAAGYVVAAWLVVQVVETIFPAFGFGDEAIRFVVIAFGIGFIPAVVVAWVFEWTPEGLKKDDGVEYRAPAVGAAAKRWDRVVMVILAIAVAFFIVDKFLLTVSPPPEPTIAVLPFRNMSSDPEQSFFSDGVSQEVHNLLARVPELRVSSWPAASGFRDQGLSSGEIAEKLDVANILEGTVRKAGNKVRVTAQLIAVASNATLWSETYERTLDDIFDIQDEVAADVVSNLRIELLGVVPKSQRTSPETRQLTIQAWAVLHGLAPVGSGKSMAEVAEALLDKALAIDPDYIQALLAKSFADLNLRNAGVITRAEEQRRWQEIKARVREIDPEDGLYNAYVAWDSVFELQDFEQANAQLQLALRNGLNNLEALRILEAIARRTGNFDAALAIGRRSQAIDPTCTRCMWQFTESLFYAGQFEQAIEAKKRLQLVSFGSGGFYHHAQALLILGDYEAALDVYRSKERASEVLQDVTIMAMAAWSMGDTGSFEENVEKLKQRGTAHDFQQVAEVYSWAWQDDLAFEWIDKAIDAGANLHWHLFLPIWENLRGDPRWGELRERLDWTDEQLSVLDFSPVLRSTS
jgi:TolB-like protein/tetratricopeptide (TPR) repeat protein